MLKETFGPSLTIITRDFPLVRSGYLILNRISSRIYIPFVKVFSIYSWPEKVPPEVHLYNLEGRLEKTFCKDLIFL